MAVANQYYNAKFFYAGDVETGISFGVSEITDDTVAAAAAIKAIGPMFDNKLAKDATATFDYGAITLPDVIINPE